MKIKLALLVVTALAGAGASVALADHGHDGTRCKEAHLSGTLAAQSLNLTVAHANKNVAAAGSTVALALPAGARVKVEACQVVAGTVTTLTIRSMEVEVRTPKVAPPATTTTGTTTS